MYLFIKWIHILSAIVAIGTNATYAVWLRAAGEEKASTRFALKGIARLEKLANPSYGLLFLSGLAMLFVGNLSWTTPWVLAGIVGFLILGALGGLGYASALRKQNELADKPDSPEFLAAQERANRFGVAILILAVIIEYFMTAKPLLWG